MPDRDGVQITIKAEGSDALKSLEKLRNALREIDKTEFGSIKRRRA
jgi:phosphotransferase system HPr-like phosphotransfer protein